MPLTLCRKANDTIILSSPTWDKDIVIRISEVRSNKAYFSIDAPDSVFIVRGELLQQSEQPEKAS